MKSSKMLETVYTGNQINERLIINNERIDNISVGADASVRPLKGNNQKGITLLALIITIIVLLILSVVSIRLITKSGIIERTKQGVIKQKLEEIQENVKLSYTSLKLGNNLSVITMSDEIKKLQENKYKKYIEKVIYTNTKVFYKMTDKLDGKEYMIDIKTGETGIYKDKLQKVAADESLWEYEGSKIKGYLGTGELLKDVTVPNVLKKKDGTEIQITNVTLSNINFEGTLTFASEITINVGTLSNCNTLDNIIIGDNVTINMGEWTEAQPFSHCKNLKTITMGKNIKMHNSFGKLNNDTAWTAAFYNSNIEEITVESLSEVGIASFYNVGSALKGNIVINEGVTTIEGWAFRGCSNITSASMPSTVTEIGDKAFENCTNLKTAKIPENIKKINSEAFYNCSNLSDEIIIKEGTTIGSSVFNKTGIPKVTIEKGVNLPVSLFVNCNKLENIIIKDNVTINMGEWTGNQPFSYCENLKTITMGKNIKMHNSFGKLNNDTAWTAAFYNSNIEEITVESLSEVGIASFYNVGSALKGNIVINEGVTTIGGWAFRGCSNITSVSIPNTVTQIGDKAFENCTNLQTINVDMTETEWNAVTKGSSWNQNVTARITFKQ